MHIFSAIECVYNCVYRPFKVIQLKSMILVPVEIAYATS